MVTRAFKNDRCEHTVENRLVGAGRAAEWSQVTDPPCPFCVSSPPPAFGRLVLPGLPSPAPRLDLN